LTVSTAYLHIEESKKTKGWEKRKKRNMLRKSPQGRGARRAGWVFAGDWNTAFNFFSVSFVISM